MKFFVLPIVLLAFLVLPVSVSGSSPRKEIRLHSIQADFIQKKHLKILVHPLVSTGTFVFQAPRSLRWEYKTPVPSILLMHGGSVKKFVTRDGRRVQDKGVRLDSMQLVLSQISSWLDGRFSDNEMFAVALADERTVLLTPKSQALSALISTIELKLADRQGYVDEITIFEGPDAYTKMTFTNRVVNEEIPDNLFIAPAEKDQLGALTK